MTAMIWILLLGLVTPFAPPAAPVQDPKPAPKKKKTSDDDLPVVTDEPDGDEDDDEADAQEREIDRQAEAVEAIEERLESLAAGVRKAKTDAERRTASKKLKDEISKFLDEERKLVALELKMFPRRRKELKEHVDELKNGDRTEFVTERYLEAIDSEDESITLDVPPAASVPSDIEEIEEELEPLEDRIEELADRAESAPDAKKKLVALVARAHDLEAALAKHEFDGLGEEKREMEGYLAELKDDKATLIEERFEELIEDAEEEDEPDERGASADPPREPRLRGKPWTDMNYGPYLSASLEVEPGNIAYKGIAIRLDPGRGGVASGNAFALFETDTLRFAAGWKGREFIDWRNILYDGSHQTHAKIRGDRVFSNPVAPGWGKPKDGSFDDPRLRGRDGKPYGPLPRAWGRWKGLYVLGNRVALSYEVGKTDILETPALEGEALTRTLRIGKRTRALILQVAHEKGARPEIDKETARVGTTTVVRVGGPQGTAWVATDDGHLRLRLPAGGPTILKLAFGSGADRVAAPVDPAPLTKGGPRVWTEEVTTEVSRAERPEDPYALDTLTVPMKNPYRSWMRLGGFDFFRDGRRAAVCTWMGDVWIVGGLGTGKLTWRRIAAGMFQPLGVRIVDEAVYVSCRDQITRLRDLNGDGETDFYESFNHDHQVTEHFHEFAMGLQTDAAGNFYYAKSARHAKDSLVPHHGTLIRVDPDGLKSEIVCNGFRAANGVGFGPEGEIAVSDQQGHWTPANRINIIKPGGFYGNMYSYHSGGKPTAFDPPTVWLPQKFDRSPAEQLWVPDDRWGPFKDRMLSLSYGTGRILHVMYEKSGGIYQGAAFKFPWDFPTGTMRGRFHPGDGQFYLCGLFGWAGDKTRAGGFYRIRYTGKPVHAPLAYKVRRDGIDLTFTCVLDRERAELTDSYLVKRWNYKWAARYGSAHYSLARPGKRGEDPVNVASAKLLDDGKTVRLTLEDFKPAMQMEVRYSLKAADGARVRQSVYCTVNNVPR